VYSLSNLLAFTNIKLSKKLYGNISSSGLVSLWRIIPAYWRFGLVGYQSKNGYDGRLLFGRSSFRVAHCRNIDFCLKYRLRTPCGAYRDRRYRWSSDGTLRATCLVSFDIGMCDAAFLYTIAGLYHALIFGEAIFSIGADVIVRHFARSMRAY